MRLQRLPRERAVQAEPVADEHVAGRHRRTEVRHEPVQELHQLVLVDLHVLNLRSWFLA
jgi:hypothetical protein